MDSGIYIFEMFFRVGKICEDISDYATEMSEKKIMGIESREDAIKFIIESVYKALMPKDEEDDNATD